MVYNTLECSYKQLSKHLKCLLMYSNNKYNFPHVIKPVFYYIVITQTHVWSYSF